MTPTLKKLLIPLIIAIGGTAILITMWVINGSEIEDLWLFIFCIWLVLYAAYEAYPKKNK